MDDAKRAVRVDGVRRRASDGHSELRVELSEKEEQLIRDLVARGRASSAEEAFRMLLQREAYGEMRGVLVAYDGADASGLARRAALESPLDARPIRTFDLQAVDISTPEGRRAFRQALLHAGSLFVLKSDDVFDRSGLQRLLLAAEEARKLGVPCIANVFLSPDNLGGGDNAQLLDELARVAPRCSMTIESAHRCTQSCLVCDAFIEMIQLAADPNVSFLEHVEDAVPRGQRLWLSVGLAKNGSVDLAAYRARSHGASRPLLTWAIGNHPLRFEEIELEVEIESQDTTRIFCASSDRFGRAVLAVALWPLGTF